MAKHQRKREHSKAPKKMGTQQPPLCVQPPRLHNKHQPRTRPHHKPKTRWKKQCRQHTMVMSQTPQHKNSTRSNPRPEQVEETTRTTPRPKITPNTQAKDKKRGGEHPSPRQITPPEGIGARMMYRSGVYAWYAVFEGCERV